jgi:hypothetical protein
MGSFPDLIARVPSLRDWDLEPLRLSRRADDDHTDGGNPNAE